MKVYTIRIVRLTDALGEYRAVFSRSFEYPEHLGFARCDRSAQREAGQNVARSRSLAGGFGATASQIGSTLIPGLEQEETNPTGFAPRDIGRMKTSAAETIGGVNASTKGLANLESARTRTAGGFAPALDEAARIKSRTLGQANLGIENENARLKQEKQQFAQRELGNLYGGLNADQLKAMGLSDEEIRTQIEAGKTGWLQNTLDTINALKPNVKIGG